MPTRFLVLAMLVLGMAGCADDPDGAESPDAPPKPRAGAAGAGATGGSEQVVAPAGWSNFTLDYSGTRLYRLPGDEPPASAWEGDPPSFCFLVPEGTRHITWELTWDPAQEMRLVIFGPNGIHGSDPPTIPPGTEVAVMGPLELDYADPPAGEWYAYAGPSSVGGPVNWTLHSDWIVAAAGVGPEQTFTDKACY